MPILTIVLAGLAILFFIGAIYCLFEGDGFLIMIIIAIGLGIWSGSTYSSYKSEQFDQLSAAEACVPNSARPVPSSATISTFKDDRVGFIYPCHFLLDQGIQPGVEGVMEPVAMRLQGNTSEALFSDQQFTATGSLNGFLLLGSGIVDGNYDAEQTTERTPVVAFMAETSYGFTNFVVEHGTVRYVECETGCVPTVSVWTSGESLFTKRIDNEKDSSIWLMQDDRSNITPLLRNGAPGSPGQTVQALATRIVVQVPPELMPSALSLGN